MAAERGATAYELRTEITLAKLMQQQNNLDRAQTVLSQRLASFTESNGTRDVLRAEALMKDLSK